MWLFSRVKTILLLVLRKLLSLKKKKFEFKAEGWL